MRQRLICKTRKGITLDDGTFIWQMMGAEGEGDPADDDTPDDDKDTDADPDDEDDPKKDKGSGDDDPEKERLKNRMKQADRRAAAAEQRLRDIELQGKSELEQVKAKLEQAEATNEELNSKLATLQQERAFLGSNVVTWHDPEMAMSKLDWASIIDSEGEVDTRELEKSIKDLAKAKPFLVKKETVETDEDNKPPASGQPSAGGKPGTGKKQTKAEMDRAALEKKYPALRG
jgi:hypothetical protein